jgi:hypothetical protein
MPDYDSVTRVMSAVCDLQDALGFIGETEAASALERSLHESFRTSTAALEDVVRVLAEVRPAVRRTLDARALEKLDACIAGARALTLPPERQSPLSTLAALFGKRK